MYGFWIAGGLGLSALGGAMVGGGLPILGWLVSGAGVSMAGVGVVGWGVDLGTRRLREQLQPVTGVLADRSEVADGMHDRHGVELATLPPPRDEVGEGWLPDPAAPGGRQRWWSGKAWTAETRALAKSRQ